MKDFLGRELAIDDKVVSTIKNYRGLIRAKIIQFTPQKVRVEYKSYGGSVETYLVDPTDIVKIV